MPQDPVNPYESPKPDTPAQVKHTTIKFKSHAFTAFVIGMCFMNMLDGFLRFAIAGSMFGFVLFLLNFALIVMNSYMLMETEDREYTLYDSGPK